MIWGAPGIGKTALVNQVLDELKEDGYDLTREYLQMSAVYRDDFVLPDTMKNSVGGTAAVDVPKTWMPVYYPVADPVEL
jgi:Cdc6-like AAA superfamily ATPase